MALFTVLKLQSNTKLYKSTVWVSCHAVPENTLKQQKTNYRFSFTRSPRSPFTLPEAGECIRHLYPHVKKWNKKHTCYCKMVKLEVKYLKAFLDENLAQWLCNRLLRYGSQVVSPHWTNICMAYRWLFQDCVVVYVDCMMVNALTILFT